MNCERCNLQYTRVHVVRGRGNYDAKILVIGEAPGRSEDVLGKAFIGESGKFLDSLLQRAGVAVDDCFFTNCVLCRPCDELGGENREPTKDEILACLPNVLSVMEALRNIAGTVLAGKVAEKWFRKRAIGRMVAITHPSALLRSGGTASPIYRDNLNKLREFCENLQY
jgi:DNA polymerase